MAERKSQINTSYLGELNRKLKENTEALDAGEIVEVIPTAKLFHVVLEVRTLVHRYVVHDDPKKAGQLAEISEGLGVHVEGTVSSVRAVEVRDVTKTGPGMAIMGEDS